MSKSDKKRQEQPEAQPDTAAVLARARAREQEAERIKADLEARQRDLTAKLPELQQLTGSVIFDAAAGGDDPQATIDNLARVKAVLDALPHAVQVAEGRRLAAMEARYRAAADDCRQQADDKDAEAAAHEVRTNELLAALAEHEGAAYQPSRIHTMSMVNAGAVIAAKDIPAKPRSMELREEAATLRRQAAGHDEQSGQVYRNAERIRAREAYNTSQAPARAEKAARLERHQRQERETRQAPNRQSEAREALAKEHADERAKRLAAVGGE